MEEDGVLMHVETVAYTQQDATFTGNVNNFNVIYLQVVVSVLALTHM